jgi:hypothetical protein
MPNVTVVAFAVCALSIGTAIHAQRVGGAQPNDDRHRTLDKITTYDEMNECQMRPNVKAARALLAADNMMESEHHAARFKWKTCSLKGSHGDFMKIVPNDPRLDELRWMSAEYFLAHDPAAVAALKPLPRQRVYDRPWFKASMRHNSIDEMAACVADINPGGIAALNKAIIGSNGEQAAFASLKGDFVTCLSAGVQLKGERKAIRGALVEALYQRTQPWPREAGN